MTFADYVAGKTIAVVGAAPLPYDQSAEIEAHDLVYRANLHKPGGWYGDRTDIVYMNAQMGRTIYDDSNTWRQHFEHVDWWVFKGKEGFRRDGYWRRAIHPRPQVKNPNAVTGILYDLVCHEPFAITVFGADLYSGGPEKAYYPGYDRFPVAKQAEGFLAHLPMEQLRLHRRIVGTGKVIGDDRYLAAVRMTDDEYRAVIDSWQAVLEEAP